MNDTSPAVNAHFESLIMQKSAEERLRMGCSMFDAAKQIVKSSSLETNPSIQEKQMRREIFVRFYGQEFTESQRNGILMALM